MSTWSSPILKNIVMSALVRRDSRVSHQRCSSVDVTLLVFLYLSVVYLAALSWTISSLNLSSWVCGFQTDDQYSMLGLTREKYAAVLVASDETLRFLLRNPSVLFAFFTALSICFFQDRVVFVLRVRNTDFLRFFFKICIINRLYVFFTLKLHHF